MMKQNHVEIARKASVGFVRRLLKTIGIRVAIAVVVVTDLTCTHHVKNAENYRFPPEMIRQVTDLSDSQPR